MLELDVMRRIRFNFTMINLFKDVCGYCSRRLKSSTTSSDVEDLPGDFLLSTLPVRTNLLITSLMWASNDVSWIIKSRYLARYFWLQAVTEYTLRLRMSHCDNNESVLFNRRNHFYGLRFLEKKNKHFRTQAPRVLKTTILLLRIIVIHTWKTLKQ